MQGIDEARLTGWLGDRCAATPPVEVHPLTASATDGAFWVGDDAGRSWVLRRPARRRPRPTAEDLRRTHGLLEALVATPVPVPAPVAFCEDEQVAGAPFSLVEFVDGRVLTGPADAEGLLDAEGRRRAAESLVDALVDLHAVEPGPRIRADFAAVTGSTAGQLGIWRHSVQAGQAAARRCLLLLEDLHRYLTLVRPPEPERPSVVHGDARLDNAVLGPDGQVLVLQGWEGATLGDPLADLAHLMVHWTDPGQQNEALGVTTTAVDGFPTRREVAERYRERSGRELDHLDFFLGLTYWKLACSLEGVYARERADGRIDAAQLDQLTHHVLRLAEAGRDALAAT